ncbi:MAG TPA: hypothetical protein VK571_02345 [Gemmatimonadaceae bacterium]|nr:hypothetical protein [Gemmatimonadaceae bacterium]
MKPDAIGDLSFDGEMLSTCLWYPRTQDPDRTLDHPVRVEVDLICVRAARPIRIEYDFDRNGYVITAPFLPAGHNDDHDCEFIWAEVSFVAGDRDFTQSKTP